MASERTRTEYLIQWRIGLWNQIRQKEDAVWRYISFFVGSLVILAGFIKVSSPGLSFQINDNLLVIISLLIMGLSYLGVVFVLDANFWMQRNLMFVGNIERELLKAKDFGELLPAAYANLNTFKYSRGYDIHLRFFFIVQMIAIIILGRFTLTEFSAGAPAADLDISVLSFFGILHSVGIIYILARDDSWIGNFFWVRQKAPGKNPETDPFDQDTKRLLVFFSSPVTYWSWILTYFGGMVLIPLGMANLTLVNVAKPILSTVFLLTLILLFLVWIHFRHASSQAKQYERNRNIENGQSIVDHLRRFRAGMEKSRKFALWANITIWGAILAISVFSNLA